MEMKPPSWKCLIDGRRTCAKGTRRDDRQLLTGKPSGFRFVDQFSHINWSSTTFNPLSVASPQQSARRLDSDIPVSLQVTTFPTTTTDMFSLSPGPWLKHRISAWWLENSGIFSSIDHDGYLSNVEQLWRDDDGAFHSPNQNCACVGKSGPWNGSRKLCHKCPLYNYQTSAERNCDGWKMLPTTKLWLSSSALLGGEYTCSLRTLLRKKNPQRLCLPIPAQRKKAEGILRGDIKRTAGEEEGTKLLGRVAQVKRWQFPLLIY